MDTAGSLFSLMPRLVVTLLTLLVPAALDADASAATSPQGDVECQYGVALALGGNAAAAESVFISLLSHSPGDARAVNNLGNLSMMGGEPGVALVFYERAAAIDSVDPGIILNMGTARMLIGDEEGSVETAAEGVRRTGGVPEAAALLGLVEGSASDSSAKGEERFHLTPDEVLSLLRAAAAKVPADTLSSPPAPPRDKPKRPRWRSGGPRAGYENAVSLVYWKY